MAHIFAEITCGNTPQRATTCNAAEPCAIFAPKPYCLTKKRTDMAQTTNSGLPYALYRDDRKTSANQGKWYARVKYLKTVTFEQFIKHISEHGSNFTRAEIAGVLYKMQDCLLELLMQGYKVEIGDLGTFYITISTSPADSIEAFNVSTNIKAANLRFRPCGKDINNLTSKELRKGTRFIPVSSLVSPSEKDGVMEQFAVAEEEGGGGV